MRGVLKGLPERVVLLLDSDSENDPASLFFLHVLHCDSFSLYITRWVSLWDDKRWDVQNAPEIWTKVWREALAVRNQFHMMSERLSWNRYENSPETKRCSMMLQYACVYNYPLFWAQTVYSQYNQPIGPETKLQQSFEEFSRSRMSPLLNYLRATREKLHFLGVVKSLFSKAVDPIDSSPRRRRVALHAGFMRI